SLSSTSQFPTIAPFKQQTFLKFLSKNPPAIQFKTSAFKSSSETCQTFYKDFLKCGNFATWLRLRTIAAQNELRRRYLEILSLGDVARWVKGRNEVELIDLLVRMRDELGSSGSKGDFWSTNSKTKTRTRPTLSREGSFTSGYTGSEGGQRHGSGSDVDSRTVTPPPKSESDFANGERMASSPLPSLSPSTPLPSASIGPSGGKGGEENVNQLEGARLIPVRAKMVGGNEGQGSTSSSFSSTASSRVGTPSRSSSSSSLNTGWSFEQRDGRSMTSKMMHEDSMDSSNKMERSKDVSRESSPERQRRRFAPEASVIKATVKQKEQLRDQIRLLIEALPVDLRESLRAKEAKSRSMGAMVTGL
ncbi:hypothetical protein BGZ94_005789, partial [Podila epigama]